MTFGVGELRVTTIDLGMLRSGFVSSHLLEFSEGPEGPVRRALVDAGTSRTIHALSSRLKDLGVSPDSIDWLFLTHVHLDHAGGAGKLIAEVLSSAQVLVHEKGAAHLVDPHRLEKAARDVYGDAIFERDYGEIVPISPERIVIGTEGQRLGFGDLLVLDTPGHARHHLAFWFETARILFTGDTFGICYPELQAPPGRSLVYPTTSPAAFEPEKLKTSIRRLAGLAPRIAYLAHFGALESPAEYAEHLCAQIDRFTNFAQARKLGNEAASDAELAAAICKDLERDLELELEKGGWEREKGLEILGFDCLLNAQGLVSWLSRS